MHAHQSQHVSAGPRTFAHASRALNATQLRARARPPLEMQRQLCAVLYVTLAGQAIAQFDLASALTKKEGRMIRKAEYMIPYHMARCPNYGWKESSEYASAEELKEKIAGIGALTGPLESIHSNGVASSSPALDVPVCSCTAADRPRSYALGAQRARRRSAGRRTTAELHAQVGSIKDVFMFFVHSKSMRLAAFQGLQ